MAKVAMFVDYDNLTSVLQRRGSGRFNHQELAEELLLFGQGYGENVQTVMWAEWDKFLPFTKQQEESPQATLTKLGFDCLYLLRPSDRSFTERAIRNKIENISSQLNRVILVSGNYPFPHLLDLNIPTTILVAQNDFSDEIGFPSLVELKTCDQVLSLRPISSEVQVPNGMELTHFYIQIQQVLAKDLRKRNWSGMSFHMLSRLLVENELCSHEGEAQHFINQAVRDGFLEREEAFFATGSRVLLRPSQLENDSSAESFYQQEDQEFRWAQLLWAMEIVLKKNPWWDYVTFSRLREELNEWVAQPTPEILQQIISSAVAEEIYLLEIEEGTPPLFRKKYKYTLGKEKEEFSRIRAIPSLVVEVMQKLIEENPYWHGVSFSKLLEELDQHPQISQQPIWIDRLRLKEWCNFLVSIGFLHAFKGKAKFTEDESREAPTLLRLVPEHSWIQHIQELATNSEADKMEESSEHDKEWELKKVDYHRIIVIIEHYLHISSNDAVVSGWIPMSTLFQVMGRSLERSYCNALVRAAREKEIIDIRTHDPKPGQHPARGAYLLREHEWVTSARKCLLKILEIVQNIQERHSITSLEHLKEALQAEEMLGETEEEREVWLSILQEENLLLLRPIFSESGEITEKMQCNLNYRDRYILSLLDDLYPDSKRFSKIDLPASEPIGFMEDLFLNHPTKKE